MYNPGALGTSLITRSTIRRAELVIRVKIMVHSKSSHKTDDGEHASSKSRDKGKHSDDEHKTREHKHSERHRRKSGSKHRREHKTRESYKDRSTKHRSKSRETDSDSSDTEPESKLSPEEKLKYRKEIAKVARDKKNEAKRRKTIVVVVVVVIIIALALGLGIGLPMTFKNMKELEEMNNIGKNVKVPPVNLHLTAKPTPT